MVPRAEVGLMENALLCTSGRIRPAGRRYSPLYKIGGKDQRVQCHSEHAVVQKDGNGRSVRGTTGRPARPTVQDGEVALTTGSPRVNCHTEHAVVQKDGNGLSSIQ